MGDLADIGQVLSLPLQFLNTAGNIYANWSNQDNQKNINAANIATNQANRQQDREWALQDWQKNADYNSPVQQMARLKAAGLNPHLVYGNGSALTPAPQVRAVESKSANRVAPQISNPFEGVLSQFTDIIRTFAQRDLAAENIKVMEAEKQLKGYQSLNVIQQTKASEQEQQRLNALQPYAIDAKKVEILRGQIEIRGIQNEILHKYKNQDVEAKKIIEDTLTTIAERTKIPAQKEQINEEISRLKAGNIGVDIQNQISELDRKLKVHGIQPHDNMVMRLIGEILVKAGIH